MSDKIEIEVNCFQIEKQGDYILIQGMGDIKIDNINSPKHQITANPRKNTNYKIIIKKMIKEKINE